MCLMTSPFETNVHYQPQKIYPWKIYIFIVYVNTEPYRIFIRKVIKQNKSLPLHTLQINACYLHTHIIE